MYVGGTRGKTLIIWNDIIVGQLSSEFELLHNVGSRETNVSKKYCV